MGYTFSWSAFFFGFLILLAGSALTIWYRPLADHLGRGVASYDRYRLAGLIACGIGFIVMLNLHTLFFSWFFGLFFGGSTT
jgi:hypothetical protein